MSIPAQHHYLHIVQLIKQESRLGDAGAPQWLNVLALLIQVVQQRVVRFVEQVPRGRCQPREDVTRAGRVLSALQPRPELTCGTAAMQ